MYYILVESTPSPANFGAEFLTFFCCLSQTQQQGIIDALTKLVFVVIAPAVSAPHPPLHTIQHWLACSIGQVCCFPLLWPAPGGVSLNNQLAKMEISMDDPDLISLSSISDSTECSSNSNLSFHSLAVMLTQTNNNVRWTSRKGLVATAP